MTPDELALVQRTFAAATAGDRGDQLTRRFYERLFEQAPDVRPLFPAELAEQRGKLLDELTAIVDALTHLDELLARTGPLGARHVAYGAQPHHYDLVGRALLGALADVLGDAWDDPARAAWTRGYDLVAEAMLLGASAS
jgi:nitric oxide dioxygenase